MVGIGLFGRRQRQDCGKVWKRGFPFLYLSETPGVRISHGRAKTHAEGLPLPACNGLMCREAPKLGGWCRAAGKEAGRVWGRCAACPASGSPVRLLPFSRPAGVGRGRAHAGRIVCKGWGGRGWPPCVFPLPSFQVARNFPPCAARVFLPIFCARG